MKSISGTVCGGNDGWSSIRKPEEKKRHAACDEAEAWTFQLHNDTKHASKSLVGFKGGGGIRHIQEYDSTGDPCPWAMGSETLSKRLSEAGENVNLAN